MLEGLAEVQKSLKKRQIKMVIKTGKFIKIIPEMAKNACEVITDANHLRQTQKWRTDAAKKIRCKFTEVETNLIVPPEAASPKEEYSARTFRMKIHKHFNRFLVNLRQTRCIKSSLGLKFKSIDIGNPETVIRKLRTDRSVGKTEFFKGGTGEAPSKNNSCQLRLVRGKILFAMASHNLAKIKIEDLEIIGYSVAGEETIIAMPQLDVCFDIGKAPDQVISINNVLLTHGHMDHSAGIAYYLSHRKFCGQRPGRVFAPENMILPIREVLDAWGRLDGNKIPGELVGMRAGDEYQIKPNLIIRAFATRHCKGSLGFCVLEKKKKLKEEYLGLSGGEIVALKRKDITIDYPVEVPIVTYLGDTQYYNFTKLDFVVKSKILIAECTFVDDEHAERALAGAHMYMSEFLRMLGELDNQYIVITHLSQRTGIVEAKRILKEKLDSRLYEKAVLLMDKRNRFSQE